MDAWLLVVLVLWIVFYVTVLVLLQAEVEYLKEIHKTVQEIQKELGRVR